LYDVRSKYAIKSLIRILNLGRIELITFISGTSFVKCSISLNKARKDSDKIPTTVYKKANTNSNFAIVVNRCRYGASGI